MWDTLPAARLCESPSGVGDREWTDLVLHFRECTGALKLGYDIPRPGELPLINGWFPFIGVFLQMKNNPLKTIKIIRKKYGNIFTLQINGNYFTFVLDPFQYTLVKNPDTNSGEIIHELREDFVKFDNEFLSLLSPLPTLSLRAVKNIWEKFLQNFSSENMSKMQETSEVIRIRITLLEKFPELQEYGKGEISALLCNNEEDVILNLGNGEVHLRKGDNTVIFPPLLHYDPEIFEQPEEFKFDHFVEDGKEKTTFFKRGQKVPYFLTLFGSGISKCPGRFFAMLEMKQFLILRFMYFDVELIEDKPQLQFTNSLFFFLAPPRCSVLHQAPQESGGEERTGKTHVWACNSVQLYILPPASSYFCGNPSSKWQKFAKAVKIAAWQHPTLLDQKEY
ncbi:LOW QUALITY PROTEIN: cytochrome P450 7B1-like [Dromiciops gliroides]|uniref:LOW QUALITY PROTEIN: cytochrome P450 7B1-like n=1 Tax=Dromiciops gliroides TaxID=33562 RepID=UPI001CC7CFAD|nr:LOW QUALITY PROTEIN: cytochrome P450 7B1-like [Dromiciops gliroides]